MTEKRKSNRALPSLNSSNVNYAVYVSPFNIEPSYSKSRNAKTRNRKWEIRNEEMLIAEARLPKPAPTLTHCIFISAIFFKSEVV